MVPILRQISPFHTFTSSFYKINFRSVHLNICFPCGLFHSGFPSKTLYALFLSLMCCARPAHIIILDLIIQNIWHGLQIMKLAIM